ncbi:S9 family peptidase [Amycolatopsis jejuensis]|uniref:S9 family peptidase n=1 Tax=Amycolatopsis jejuensis TaxID=330084 RepID=UPI000524FB60|nr:S9 family peptidase [Amycolatopsis jejuensis]
MQQDLRGTAEYEAVADHFRRLHEPALSQPHSLKEVHVSPDGTQVVVTGSVYEKLDGLPKTALYRVENGELWPLADGSARWARFSPDGTLSYLTDAGSPGAFQLRLLGDDAAPDVPGTVEFSHWSPDGRQILLCVAGLGADLSGGQGSGTNVGAAPAAAEWLPRVESTEDTPAWRSLWLYTVDSGELVRLSPEGLNCWEATWCGPSQVVAVTSPAPGEDHWYSAVVTLLDVPTGATRELYRSDVQLGVPAGSPDGTRVAVVQAVCSDRWLVAGDLVLLEVATGESTVVDTAGTDVTCLQWIDEGRLGYLGRRHLDSVAGIAGGSELFSVGHACGGGWYPDGTFTSDGRLCTVRHAYRLPPQIVLSGPDGDDVLASVAHDGTKQLLAVAGTAAPVSWTAPDGWEIEGVLCTPDGPGPFPLVVNIHGGPIWSFQDCWTMNYAWVPLLVSRGYAVLNPNPRGSSGRGQEFAGAVVHDMGGADASDLLSGMDALVERGIVDPARIGLIGRSYGGFMSSWLVTRSTRFAAAIPTSPVTDWYSQSFTSNIAGWGNAFLGGDPERPGGSVHERSPVLHASRVRTPTLNVAGALDRCTPPGQAEEFHRALQAHGVVSELVLYPGEGHGVFAQPALTDFLTRITGWFARFMPA